MGGVEDLRCERSHWEWRRFNLRTVFLGLDVPHRICGLRYQGYKIVWNTCPHLVHNTDS